MGEHFLAEVRALVIATAIDGAEDSSLPHFLRHAAKVLTAEDGSALEAVLRRVVASSRSSHAFMLSHVRLTSSLPPPTSH